MNYVQFYCGQPLTLEQSRVADDLSVFTEFMQGQHGKSLIYQLAAVLPSR